MTIFTIVLAYAGLSFTRPEIVTAHFASPAQAAEAQIAIAPLPDGRKLAFTSRWDDSSWQHLERAEMFHRAGVTPMFFLNGDMKYYKEAVPKLKALGARFGNHTVGHPFLMESGVNLMFREVMENKLRIECFADTPNTSFAIPFNWNSPLEPNRAAKLVKILVDGGIFVSSDWPMPSGGKGASEWMPGFTFKGNDTAPNDKEFYRNLTNAVNDVAKNPDYPKITFGIHSWCKPEGLLVQEKWLNAVKKQYGEEWWITDDAHYGAYRYEFFHARTKKLGVKGNTAVFEVLRHDPAFLGEVQPLTYTFGSVKPVKVEVQDAFPRELGLPEKIDRMENGVSAKFPALKLSVAVDEQKGELAYDFSGDAEVVQVVVIPAPMWSNSRILAKEKSKIVSLGTASDQADYREGDHFYVVGVDFVHNGVRGRLYATENVPGAARSFGGTPRDTMMVLGPVDMTKFPDETIAAMAIAGKMLPNIGEGIEQYWRSMADKSRCGFSAASYIPWDPAISAEFKSAMSRAKPKDRPVFLAALEFECDADGEKDLLVNRAKWESCVFFLNGKCVRTKGGTHRIAVKKGLNRLIYCWEWFQPWIPQACLISVCDDKDVNKPVKFVTPKTQLRECVFESDGFSVEFDPRGNFRRLEYGGKKSLGSIGYESSKSLPAKKDYTPIVTFDTSADRIICTRECPIGVKHDDFAEKVTVCVSRDKISVDCEITIREGVAWKGFNLCSSLQSPIEFYAGRKLKLVDQSDQEREIDYPAEFDAKSCRLPGSFKILSNGEWKISLDDAQLIGFMDRRQWNNNSAGLQFCPKGGLQWGGKVSDGKTMRCSWSATREQK